MPQSDRGRVVIHAGTGKAGSTAIQNWLRDHPELLARYGFTFVVGRPSPGADLMRLGPYERGPGTSGPVSRQMHDRDLGDQAISRFADELDRLAAAHGSVVVSAEGLARLFSEPDRRLAEALSRLGQRHEVRIAYYVRPQHTALEARWRQWGFRTGQGAARYVSGQAGSLHYLDTLRGAADALACVDFRMRPFRRDQLAGGDVAKDFAVHMLDMDPNEASEGTPSNVGMPLAVVNALAAVPAGLLWESVHDSRRMGELGRLISRARHDGESPLGEALRQVERADDRPKRGRRVLQRWAHRRYAAENDALLRLAGWDAHDWLTDVEAESDDLAALDSLWSPSGSQAEQNLLRLLLEEVRAERPPAEQAARSRSSRLVRVVARRFRRR